LRGLSRSAARGAGLERKWGVTPNPVSSLSGAAKSRLSIVQKCDLAGQAIAAVITTGLLAAPFVAGFAAESPRVEAVVTLAGPASIPVLSTPQLPAPSLPSPAPRHARRTPVLKSTFLAQSMPVAVDTTEKMDLRGRKESRKPLGRKLAGLFVGDGSYTVRPFPTIPQ
jgi:hypothetical protein